MTIAFDASLWDEPITGIGLYTHQLAGALRAQGVELELWGARTSGDAPRKGRGRSTWTLGELPKLLEARRPAVYHAVANFNLPLTRAAVPYVLTVHDVVPLLMPETVSTAYRWQFRAWLTRSLKIADEVICISHTTARTLRSHFDVHEQKLTVVHLGVDHVKAVPPADRTSQAWLDALGLPERFVLYAGALDARKNVELVLEACGRLHAGGRKVTLVLAGQRWFGASALERRIVTLKEAGLDVRTLGYLADSVFYALMRRAGVFVFPSRYEGFGLPPLEAMSLGVPTIVSDAGSLPEVCGDGAWQVGVDDAAGLAEKIERLLSDEKERAALAKKGVAHARKFTWAQTARRTAEVYRGVAPGVSELLNPSPQPSPQGERE